MSEIKITDKRMFTAEGELRDGFDEDVDAAERPPDSAAEPKTQTEPAASVEPAPERAAAAMPEATPDVDPAGARAPHVDLPPSTSAYGSPGFLDLVAMLAEPVAIYLGDAPMPGGESAENLDLARMHIDLLEVLREKTSGNLSSQELTIMDDLLYRLRVRYVEKRG